MEFLKEFFVFNRSKDKKDTIIGKCKLCDKDYSDHVGSTGNFHKHLQRKHSNRYRKSRHLDSVSPDNDADTNQLPENLSEYTKKINESILEELMVKCNLPFGIVEKVAFRKFLKTLAPKWKHTSSKYFTGNLLPTLASSIRDAVKELLNDVNHLSITVDVWSDRRGKSFIGITGHFLDSCCIPQAILLDFRRLKGPHTGDNIRLMTEDILENLKIMGKVYRIITDNASSMLKAYKFGLSVNDSDSADGGLGEERNDLFLEVREGENGSSLANEWVLVDWCESNIDLDDDGEDESIRLSCYAHSLQLAIRDGLKDAPHLSKCLSKCMRLARRAHKSTKIADLLESVGKSISRSNVTRWCSEYLLIKSILALGKNTLDEITNLIEDHTIRFTSDDMIILQETIEILEPFAEITSRIQSESAVTASLVVPSIVHLLDHVKVMKPAVSFLQKMCLQLEESINERFSGIVKRLLQQTVLKSDPFSDPIYFVCTVLDPQFKFYWINQMNHKATAEIQMKQCLIQMIVDECGRNTDTLDQYIQSSSPSASAVNSQPTQVIGNLVIKKRKLFQYHDNDVRNSSLGSSMSPMDEINAYINDPLEKNFSPYWKNSQLVLLKNVVKRVFSVQASSAPIERAFSQAGIIMSPRRTSMREEVFRNLVFLRVNQDLI